MGRTRKQTEAAQDTSFTPSEFENPATPIVDAVAGSTHLPEQTGYIANPSSKRRDSFAARVKLPSTLAVAAGDLVVKLVDKGDNRAGIGIQVELPEGRTLTAEEKQVIRDVVRGEDDQSGFQWNGRMWHKEIARQGEPAYDVPPARAVAIRLDAENRVTALAEALREHQTDPVGFAERVAQQREREAGQERTPG